MSFLTCFSNFTVVIFGFDSGFQASLSASFVTDRRSAVSPMKPSPNYQKIILKIIFSSLHNANLQGKRLNLVFVHRCFKELHVQVFCFFCGHLVKVFCEILMRFFEFDMYTTKINKIILYYNGTCLLAQATSKFPNLLHCSGQCLII